MQPQLLQTRIAMWAEEQVRLGTLPPKASNVLNALLYRGELPRGELAAVVGVGERQARRIVFALDGLGVIASESTRAPLRLAFPATLASRWMPGLFPDQ
jgi:transcription initiation factor IIE alpha subunit